MGITLTERAAQEIQRTMTEQSFDEEGALRIAIAAGGCSGYSYKLTLDENVDESNDHKYEFHGVKVVVDKKSALLLDGTTIDFYEGIDRRGFDINNPNAQKSCGCGSSFTA